MQDIVAGCHIGFILAVSTATGADRLFRRVKYWHGYVVGMAAA